MTTLLLLALSAGAAQANPTTSSTDAPEVSEVQLYESLEDWRAGRAIPHTNLPVEVDVDTRRVRSRDAVRSFQTVNVDRPVAKAVGHVAVVQVGDELFYNDSAPRPFRSRSYGPMQVIGDQALYAREACAWIAPTDSAPGSVVCWNEVRSIDLDTLAHDTLSRRQVRKTLKAHPDLFQEYRNESSRDANARWRATEAVFARTESGEF